MNWSELFLPTVPLVEIVIRGSAIYLALFLGIRVFLKREVGTVGLADLLFIVLIADATQNGMASDHRSIGDALVLVATLLAWNYSLDWLAFHHPAFERIIQPPPLLLVKNGTMIWRNMRRELITKEELLSQLREQGVDEVSEVKLAHMENNGRISVIRNQQSQ
jgi:uncharacterized membrane protein YcaP (DUF421 family)